MRVWRGLSVRCGSGAWWEGAHDASEALVLHLPLDDFGFRGSELRQDVAQTPTIVRSPGRNVDIEQIIGGASIPHEEELAAVLELQADAVQLERA
jgi:hypothetical protein